MSTNPTLTAERLRERLDYEPLTGEFTYRIRCGRSPKGSVAGSTDVHGYRQIQITGVVYKAHRLAWLHVHGTWPVGQIDHINGNRSDNSIANLREATNRQNCQNTVQTFGTTVSGYRGVSWHKQNRRWESRISVGGRTIRLGLFATPEEASTAYLAAKHELHPFWGGCLTRR